MIEERGLPWTRIGRVLSANREEIDQLGRNRETHGARERIQGWHHVGRGRSQTAPLRDICANFDLDVDFPMHAQKSKEEARCLQDLCLSSLHLDGAATKTDSYTRRRMKYGCRQIDQASCCDRPHRW